MGTEHKKSGMMTLTAIRAAILSEMDRAGIALPPTRFFKGPTGTPGAKARRKRHKAERQARKRNRRK